MIAREKAVRIVNKYLDEVINEVDENCPLELPKRLAIIAVNEIIQHIEKAYYNEDIIKGAKIYWQEVKQEIEKL